MNNDKKTLFIFEGGRSEERYVEKLEQNFLGSKHGIKCVYDAEIYQLYNAVKGENLFTLDIVSMLKERTPKNAEILKEYNRNSFAYIYLFFDYDAHSTLADDAKIKEMLEFFNDETQEGKLFISYPMIEAIRHFKDHESFRTLTVKCKRNNCIYRSDCKDVDECLSEPHYKNFSIADAKPQLSNINKYTGEVWKELITAHLCKANYLVNNSYNLPESLISQESIFQNQIEKHISHRCPEVAVLSAFPLYTLYYYGYKKIREMLIPQR